MSSNSATHDAAPPAGRAIGVALAVIGLVMVVNGAWYAPIMFNMDPAARLSQYGGELPFQVFQTIHLAALVALAVVSPHLGRVRGRTGRTLPGWLVTALSVLTILQAATVYTQAFVVPFLADVAPQALDTESIDLFALSMMVIWSAFSLAFVVAAIVGVVRRIVPVVAAVAIALGALSMPILGPAGSLLIGAGLAYWALTRVAGQHVAETVAVEAPSAMART